LSKTHAEEGNRAVGRAAALPFDGESEPRLSKSVRRRAVGRNGTGHAIAPPPRRRLVRALTMHPRRVLFLVASDWYFYWHRLSLAERIAAAGYEVHVATPAGRFCGAIEAAGLRHHPIRMDRQGRNPFKDLATLKRLVDLYRALSPDLVHHVAVKPIIYGSIAAKITKVPVIVNAMPGMGYVFLSNQLLARLIRPGIMTAFRLLNGANSRVILENRDNMRQWIAWRVLRPDRTVVIPGAGVDTGIFKPVPEPPGTPLVLLSGRLLFDKGVGEFVEAARLLKQRGVQARFALLGEGDPGNPASIPPEQLRAWARDGTIELLGWRDDVAETVAQCHVACLPSYGEGLPRALLEAMACGKPVVATDVPGCRDVVRDGENGFLVPARQAGPLADAIERLVVDAALRRSMGARGRARAVAEFSVEIVAAETLRLYADLLGSTVAKKAHPIDSKAQDAAVDDGSS
jgi:glycosyltransferase involved in cell wall biosynthesis